MTHRGGDPKRKAAGEAEMLLPPVEAVLRVRGEEGGTPGSTPRSRGGDGRVLGVVCGPCRREGVLITVGHENKPEQQSNRGLW